MTQVTAAIMRQKDKTLICKRGEGGPCSFLWEFPGGKLEPGETLQESLVREVREELDLEITVGDVFEVVRYNYGDKEMVFTFFNAEIGSGILKCHVHEDAQWVRLKDLLNYDFCPADVAVVKRLAGTAMQK